MGIMTEMNKKKSRVIQVMMRSLRFNLEISFESQGYIIERLLFDEIFARNIDYIV